MFNKKDTLASLKNEAKTALNVFAKTKEVLKNINDRIQKRELEVHESIQFLNKEINAYREELDSLNSEKRENSSIISNIDNIFSKEKEK